MTVALPRALRKGDVGADVEGISRALCRAGVFMPIRAFQAADLKWRRTYGSRRVDAVNRIRKGEGWSESGVYNEPVHQVLLDGGYFDARAIALVQGYTPPKPPVAPAQRIRDAITDFCERAERAEAKWHYTQRRPYTGLGVAPESVHYNDCSSYVALAYFWAKTQTGLDVPDPTKYAFKGWGNTWDDLDGHPRVTSQYLVGDLAHYEGHVTICRKPGTSSTSIWSSFGREAGPERTTLHYRRDLRFVVRPPLL